MKYLALPTEERIKLQAQPFDGKKACWVPDAKESFIAAEISSTKAEEITVKTAKGDVCIFTKNDDDEYILMLYLIIFRLLH